MHGAVAAGKQLKNMRLSRSWAALLAILVAAALSCFSGADGRAGLAVTSSMLRCSSRVLTSKSPVISQHRAVLRKEQQDIVDDVYAAEPVCPLECASAAGPTSSMLRGSSRVFTSESPVIPYESPQAPSDLGLGCVAPVS